MIEFPRRGRVLRRETAIHRSYKSKCGRYRIVHIEPYSKLLPARWLVLHKLDNGNEEIINGKARTRDGGQRLCEDHAARVSGVDGN